MAEVLSPNELQQIPLFSELNSDELQEIMKSGSTFHFPKGSLIFQEDDEYRGFYIVLQGSVKVYKLTGDGKETIFHIITPMNTLAEVPIFLGGGYPAYAQALENTKVILMQKNGFLGMLYQHPGIAIKMLAGLSKRLKVLGAQIENLTSHDVKSRLAKYLYDEYQKVTDTVVIPTITLPISKSLLAARLGTIGETLSRAFKKLQEEGFIEVKRNKIFFKDINGLRKMYVHR